VLPDLTLVSHISWSIRHRFSDGLQTKLAMALALNHFGIEQYLEAGIYLAANRNSFS